MTDVVTESLAEVLNGPRPVSWIANLQPASHGAWEGDAAGRAVLDFSANGNVIGPSESVRRAVAAVDLSRYPERTSISLRQRLAQHHGVSPEMVVAGNGSTELIWAVARAYLTTGSVSLVLGPTYGEYATASRATGAEVREIRAHAIDLSPDIEGAVARAQPAVIWLCHPNNPTGGAFPLDVLSRMNEASPRTLFVVDEAYWTLAEGLDSALRLIPGGNVLVLRSLTKDMALAGLRVGYALAALPVAGIVQRALPPWNVNSLAQAAAVAALADSEHLDRARRAVAVSRAHLEERLRDLGLEPWLSQANFVTVPVGEGSRVTNALLERGLAVRDCTSFGLPHCIRIGVRGIDEQELLLDGLASVVPRAMAGTLG